MGCVIRTAILLGWVYRTVDGGGVARSRVVVGQGHVEGHDLSGVRCVSWMV